MNSIVNPPGDNETHAKHCCEKFRTLNLGIITRDT